MDCWPFQPRSFAKLNVDDNKKWKTIFICEKSRKRDRNELFTKYSKFHKLVSVAVGYYASNHWSWSDQDHFSFVDVTFLKNSFVSNFISGVLKPWC